MKKNVMMNLHLHLYINLICATYDLKDSTHFGAEGFPFLMHKPTQTSPCGTVTFETFARYHLPSWIFFLGR